MCLLLLLLLAALLGDAASTSRPAARLLKTAAGSTGRRVLLGASNPHLQPAEAAGQVAVSSRLSPVKVPVESGAVLKCLISGPQPAEGEPVRVLWSRASPATNQEPEQLATTDWQPHTLSQQQQQQQQVVVANLSSASTSSKRQLPPLVGDFSAPEEQLAERQRQLRNFLARSRQETRRVSNLILEASLAINPVRIADNGTYFCTAMGQARGEPLGQARIELTAMSRPRVELVRVQFARDSRSALVVWLLATDGNLPLIKTVLVVRNDTFSASDLQAAGGQEIVTTGQGGNQHHWRRIDIPGEGQPLDMGAMAGGASRTVRRTLEDRETDVDITSPQGASSGFSDPSASSASSSSPPTQLVTQHQQSAEVGSAPPANRRMRAYNLTGLQPGVTYSFRLSAINDMGSSSWSDLVATAPNEVPVQITEIQLLGASNETLAIGWRRPHYDTAKTVRYEMQLFDLNRTLTLDAYTNTSTQGPARNNFMYVFVNLQPGTDYHFQVRACSRLGCSSWSQPRLLASTADGEPDEPTEVEISCDQVSGELAASWLQPLHPRGQLLNYTVHLEARAHFWNGSGGRQLDQWTHSQDTPDNQTLSLVMLGPSAGSAEPQQHNQMQPNTNYSVRVCANNRSSRCGRFSSPTTRSQCSTPAQLPRHIPATLKLRLDPATEGLALEVPPLSGRNGSVDCLEVALIRLPGSYAPGASLTDFVPARPQELAEHMSHMPSDSTNQNPQLVYVYLAEQVGLEPSQDKLIRLQLGDGRPSTVEAPANGCGPLASSQHAIRDLKLQPSTYYSAFVRLLMASPAQLGYSDYLEPVMTGASVPELSLGPTISRTPVNQQPGSGAGEDDAAIMAQHLRELASRVGSSLSAKALALYQQASGFLADNVSLEGLTEMLRKSSPGMQVLQVGALVICLSLLLLLLAFLIRMPLASSRRKQRSKQHKLKNPPQALDQQLASEKSAHLGPIEPLQVSAVDPLLRQQQQQQQQEYVALPDHHLSPRPDMQSSAQLAPPAPPPPLPADSMAPSGLENSLPQQHYKQHHEQTGYSHTLQRGVDQQQQQQYRNCRTMRRQSQKYLLHNDDKQFQQAEPLHGQEATYSMTLSGQSAGSSVLAHAKKINKSIPLHLFAAVHECRLANGWLREEYEQLPRPQLDPSVTGKQQQAPQQRIKLRAQLVVSRDDSISALISGNEYLDASVVQLPGGGGGAEPRTASTCGRKLICARSPLDADSVWDLWRLVYEQEVAVIVMLGQVEDAHTGELRCAQYWPTSDNEETTILSPCNEYVQGSMVQPAKFKIRQETLSGDATDDFRVRRLTLMVMATRPEENAPQATAAAAAGSETPEPTATQVEAGQDEEKLVIIERSVIHLQYTHWNSSTPEARARLIKFVEQAAEQHLRASQPQLQDSPARATTSGYQSPMLVHCYNGLGRTGLFAAMSGVLDELATKLSPNRSHLLAAGGSHQQPRINLFQLVSELRHQRDLLLSPYRLYELLYQLTAACIPPTVSSLHQQQVNHAHHHAHHHHHHSQNPHHHHHHHHQHHSHPQHHHHHLPPDQHLQQQQQQYMMQRHLQNTEQYLPQLHHASHLPQLHHASHLQQQQQQQQQYQLQ